MGDDPRPIVVEEPSRWRRTVAVLMILSFPFLAFLAWLVWNAEGRTFTVTVIGAVVIFGGFGAVLWRDVRRRAPAMWRATVLLWATPYAGTVRLAATRDGAWVEVPEGATVHVSLLSAVPWSMVDDHAARGAAIMVHGVTGAVPIPRFGGVHQELWDRLTAGLESVGLELGPSLREAKEESNRTWDDRPMSVRVHQRAFGVYPARRCEPTGAANPAPPAALEPLDAVEGRVFVPQPVEFDEAARPVWEGADAATDVPAVDDSVLPFDVDALQVTGTTESAPPDASVSGPRRIPPSQSARFRPGGDAVLERYADTRRGLASLAQGGIVLVVGVVAAAIAAQSGLLAVPVTLLMFGGIAALLVRDAVFNLSDRPRLLGHVSGEGTVLVVPGAFGFDTGRLVLEPGERLMVRPPAVSVGAWTREPWRRSRLTLASGGRFAAVRVNPHTVTIDTGALAAWCAEQGVEVWWEDPPTSFLHVPRYWVDSPENP